MLVSWSELASGRADAMDGAAVELIGWMAPPDIADRHAYFLLAPEPICCLGCLPRDPLRCVEVFARRPIPASGRPVRLAGRLRCLTDDPAGWRYQLREAEPVDPVEGALTAAVTRRGLFAAGASLALAACGEGGPAPVADPGRGAAARQLIDSGVTIDIHSHAGRINRAHAPLESVAGPMREGGMAVICLAIVADSPTIHTLPDRRIAAFRDPAPGELYRWSGTAFARVQQLVAEERLAVVTDAASLQAARTGGPAVVMAAEGADFLERSLARLDEAYATYQLRHLQLTHYRVNDLGDIQTEEPVHGGLTDFGAEVIRACNRLGIVVDVAHGTYDLVKRAAATTTKPLVLSHTSLSPSPGRRSRLISGDHARLIAETGGVIGIWPPTSVFADKPALAAGMARMVDVVGIDHVGLGSDMLGLTSPSVFAGYDELPALAEALLAPGLRPGRGEQAAGRQLCPRFRRHDGRDGLIAAAAIGLAPPASGPDIMALGGWRRTGPSPTRSGPEGSSRNEFWPGSLSSFPPLPSPAQSVPIPPIPMTRHE